MYLGSQTVSSETDIKTRKRQAWKACNKLTKIWKSSLSGAFKICLFQAVDESVLKYGSETWTPTRALEIQLDGCYWRDHVTNEDLYGNLPRLSEKLRRRRLQFAGHCYQAKDKAVSKTVLWTPTNGRKSRGRPSKIYVDLPSDDIGLSGRDLETTMLERCHWRYTIFLDPRTTN